MSDVKPNAELAWRVLDHIDAHPETWEQESWHLGSSYCFGGWAVVLDGVTLDEEDEVIDGPEEIAGLSIEEAAHHVLGLDYRDAWSKEVRDDLGFARWLFGVDNTREDLGHMVAEMFGPRPESVS